MTNIAITVETSEPIRLDRYLRRIYPGFSQGIIEKALRKKDITLNGAKATSAARVKSPDLISLSETLLPELPSKDKIAASFAPAVISLAEKLISEYLIHSDKNFIAINKPAELAVQGGSKIKFSISDALDYLNATYDRKLKLVHRLDKDTSGVLLIAEGHENSAKLAKAFEDREIRKKYLSGNNGCPKDTSGKIVNLIGKERSGRFETVQ